MHADLVQVCRSATYETGESSWRLKSTDHTDVSHMFRSRTRRSSHLPAATKRCLKHSSPAIGLTRPGQGWEQSIYQSTILDTSLSSSPPRSLLSPIFQSHPPSFDILVIYSLQCRRTTLLYIYYQLFDRFNSLLVFVNLTELA